MIEVTAEPVEMVSDELIANGHGNGQAHLPDFYGPFLTPDEMRRPNPRPSESSLLKVEMGDYLVRTTGSRPFEPSRHSRFILNVLLLQPQGGIHTRLLHGMGFSPDSTTDNARSQAVTRSIKLPEEKLNKQSSYQLIEREGSRSSLFIALAPEVEIIRLADDELQEKITVRLPQTNGHAKGNGTAESSRTHPSSNGVNGSSNGHGAGNGNGKAKNILPYTRDEFIPVRSFEEPAFTGTRAYIYGESDDMPIIETPQDLKRAKNALVSLAGQLKTPLQIERYALANELIIEFTLSEQEELPLGMKSGAHLNGGEKTYPPGQEWREDAFCNGMDPEYFYPERGESIKQAKAVCRACVVKEECLDLAIAKGEKFGIWGGKSERERRRIRRERKKATAAAKDEGQEKASV